MKSSTVQITIFYIFPTRTTSQLSLLLKYKHCYLAIPFFLFYGAVIYLLLALFHHLRRPYCLQVLPLWKIIWLLKIILFNNLTQMFIPKTKKNPAKKPCNKTKRSSRVCNIILSLRCEIFFTF